MQARLLEVIQSDAPDVATFKGLLTQGQVVPSALMNAALDEYQVDRRNEARKDIILSLLDYLKNNEDPDYVLCLFLGYQRFGQLFFLHNSIAFYKICEDLFRDRLYHDRLSVSHLKKSVSCLASSSDKMADGVLYLKNHFLNVAPQDKQAMSSLNMGEQGESSIVGFLMRHHFFAAMQRGELKTLFGRPVTTWSDFITALSEAGLDTHSEFILYDQGEQPMGIARFLREKLNQPAKVLSVMTSPAADLIMSKEDRQAGLLNSVFDVGAFIERNRLLAKEKTIALGLSDVFKETKIRQLEKDKKQVQAYIESGAIAASRLTLPFLAVATRVMRVSVVLKRGWVSVSKNTGDYYSGYHARPYGERQDQYDLTFEKCRPSPVISEGLLAKLSESDESWIASQGPETLTPFMIEFVSYLTPEQADRLVGEFASGVHESRLGHAMAKMFNNFNSKDYFYLYYERDVNEFCAALIEKCQNIPVDFIKRLPIKIKAQFCFKNYHALLLRAGITGVDLATELKSVFADVSGVDRTLDEVKAYLRLLISSGLPLVELMQAMRVLIINKKYCFESDGYDFKEIVRLIAKDLNLSVYEVCRALPGSVKNKVSVASFLSVLMRTPDASMPSTPLADIALLLTQDQRDEMRHTLISGLSEGCDITKFIEHKGDFSKELSYLISEEELKSYRHLSLPKELRIIREANLRALNALFELLPNFRDWRALGVNIGWSHQGKTLLDRWSYYQRNPYHQFKFYFMNVSLQAYYRSLPLSSSAAWCVMMTALTALSQDIYNTPCDEALGLNSFEQSLVFWMTQKEMHGDAIVAKLNKDLFGQQNMVRVKWKHGASLYEKVKKSKITNECALNESVIKTTDDVDSIWMVDEVLRLASFWMFETGVVSKSSKGLIQPIQAGCLALLKRHESLRVALREQMVLGAHCLLSTILQESEQDKPLSKETKAYIEARTLLRETPVSDACVSVLAQRVHYKKCTVRDVVLYLGLAPSLTNEKFSAIANEFLDKSIDKAGGSEHEQIQDALLSLTLKEAKTLKRRLSFCMVTTEVGRPKLQVLFAKPENEANDHLIWHIIHAGRTTATIQKTKNAKQVKECLDHPEYSSYKIHALFKQPQPAGALVDSARMQDVNESRVGAAVDNFTLRRARDEHEKAQDNVFPI